MDIYICVCVCVCVCVFVCVSLCLGVQFGSVDLSGPLSFARFVEQSHDDLLSTVRLGAAPVMGFQTARWLEVLLAFTARLGRSIVACFGWPRVAISLDRVVEESLRDTSHRCRISLTKIRLCPGRVQPSLTIFSKGQAELARIAKMNFTMRRARLPENGYSD